MPGARFAEASGDADAPAGFETCSAALRSLPAAGETLALRAPKVFFSAPAPAPAMPSRPPAPPPIR